MSEQPPSIEASTATVRRSKWAVASMIFVAVAVLAMVVAKEIPSTHGWSHPGRALAKGLLWVGGCASMLVAGVCCFVAVCKDRFRKSEVVLSAVFCVLAPTSYYVFVVWWPTPKMLVIAAADNDFDRVNRCLKFGVDINVISPHSGHPYASRKTALTAAAVRGHATMTDFLIRHGADPNQVDGNGKTPWESSQSAKVARLLLDAGAKVNGQIIPRALYAPRSNEREP